MKQEVRGQIMRTTTEWIFGMGILN